MATATAAEDMSAGAMTPQPFRVASREQDTVDTWTVTLEPVAGPEPVIAPGQFMMVYAFGIGEVPISVSGPPGRPGPVVLTVRAVGAVSRAICGSEPGAVLGLRGPFGTSWPVEAAAGGDVVVVAGGIGLAPLRPVLLHALARPGDYERVTLLYGARTPADLLYTSQLDGWRGSLVAAVTVDTAGPGWGGPVGFVAKLVARAELRPERATAFVCGPEIMMRTTIDALLGRGMPAGRIHVSMERHMDCGVGLCGHCQLGPTLICRDGPVYPYPEIAPWMEVREL
jgi:anaerobic sulfite reductase subunit B